LVVQLKISVMFRGQEVLTKLIEKITAVMREHQHAGTIVWPQHRFTTFKPSNALAIDPKLACYLQGGAYPGGDAALPTHLRPWLTLRAGRAATSRAVAQSGDLAAAEVLAFSAEPLSPIRLSAAVATHTRAQRGLHKLTSELPFDLRRHPAAGSELAAAMLRRLEEDVKAYAALENAAALPQLVGFSRAEIAACIGPSSAAHTSASAAGAERCRGLMMPLPSTAVAVYCRGLLMPWPSTAVTISCRGRLLMPRPSADAPSAALLRCTSVVVGSLIPRLAPNDRTAAHECQGARRAAAPAPAPRPRAVRAALVARRRRSQRAPCEHTWRGLGGRCGASRSLWPRAALWA
jgi:hypothetical protein